MIFRFVCPLTKTAVSTVGLLETSTSGAPTELLRLTATWVCNEERAVIAYEDIPDLFLGCLIDVLLVVGNNALGDSLADSIYLASEATTLAADLDVNLPPLLLAKQQQRLVDFYSEDIR